ncbi:hypothetical protein CQW23_33646 [Capsicum baccatum]|uniref:Uncharacterized protein n=1 Tax=Capsicum baccatum TaxID=33114 RepID=A0A2G2V1H2_CAPBA|nr:hypothetical protein CQW23_33646 [Capsicum baccatum]
MSFIKEVDRAILKRLSSVLVFHKVVSGYENAFLLLDLVGRVAYSNVVNLVLPLQYQRILCHKIGCALPLPLYQKIALCGRLTLNFSQWEESPYLRFFVWHSKLSFLRETESVTTEALSTCPVFG